MLICIGITVCLFQSMSFYLTYSFIFTRGQFWPSGIVGCLCVSVSVSVCVCVSVNHELVHAITHQHLKLESLNLGQICKVPCLRSLLLYGAIKIYIQGQIEINGQNLPRFEVVSSSMR